MLWKSSIFIGSICFLVIIVFYLYPKYIVQATKSEHSDVVITLERTACHGKCPVYKLVIYGDGNVVYNGEAFVKVKGEHTSRIPEAQLQELLAVFDQTQYFSLQDEYTASITDLPTVKTSITIDGKTKYVVNYYGAPEELKQLEMKIDEISNSKQWVL